VNWFCHASFDKTGVDVEFRIRVDHIIVSDNTLQIHSTVAGEPVYFHGSNFLSMSEGAVIQMSICPTTDNVNVTFPNGMQFAMLSVKKISEYTDYYPTPVQPFQEINPVE
jgi:hypothetical protein